MADASGNVEAAQFGIGIPVANRAYALKGANNYDWGMKDRLARVFAPKTGRTLMLAFDHGYLMGPTSGLERIDLAIPPLVAYADCLMCTRGVLRTSIAPTHNKPIALRCSAGSTVLTELNDECVGVEIEDALRLNACLMAVMVEVGGKHEALTIRNLCRVIETGNRYGVPTLGVTAVGRDMARDARYLGLASRVVAENGAQVVKTYYCDEGFERVTAGCPVPIVVAGGKKLPEPEALEMAFRAIDQGAAGVDMGRNIFQAEDPAAMIQAVRSIVHDDRSAAEAFELYRELKKA
jgi:3-hydroxy-5-phosphonooxypentane-2,4-dione thiolase